MLCEFTIFIVSSKMFIFIFQFSWLIRWKSSKFKDRVILSFTFLGIEEYQASGNIPIDVWGHLHMPSGLPSSTHHRSPILLANTSFYTFIVILICVPL